MTLCRILTMKGRIMYCEEDLLSSGMCGEWSSCWENSWLVLLRPARSHCGRHRRHGSLHGHVYHEHEPVEIRVIEADGDSKVQQALKEPVNCSLAWEVGSLLVLRLIEYSQFLVCGNESGKPGNESKYTALMDGRSSLWRIIPKSEVVVFSAFIEFILHSESLPHTSAVHEDLLPGLLGNSSRSPPLTNQHHDPRSTQEVDCHLFPEGR